MKHHILFVPGIGDDRTFGQDKGIAWWRVFGVQGHYHAVGWADGEHFEPKLDRLLKQIDGFVENGDAVSLLGFSAGASAVLNAFAQRKSALAGVACVSGKINHPTAAQNYFQRNPAFAEALHSLQSNVATFSSADKARLLTLNPLQDSVVPYADAVIPGVKQWRIPAFTHAMAVAVTLTVYALPLIIHFRRLAK